jgi:hypothetical protein
MGLAGELVPQSQSAGHWRKVEIFEGVEEYWVLWTLDMKKNPWARLLA